MKETVLLLESGFDEASIFPDRAIRVFQVGIRKIAVCKARGEYYAFNNSCPHSDYPLNEGVINHFNEIVCPWHGYRFNLTTGAESTFRCKGLSQFEIEKNAMGALVLFL